MARTRMTTAQRVAQRQRAKGAQEKKVKTYKKLGVPRAGPSGATYRGDAPVHSWPLYMKNADNAAGAAGDLKELELRRKQIVQMMNFARMNRRQALRDPEAANPRALSFSLTETERNYKAAMATHARRKSELEKTTGNAAKARKKPKKKPKKRKKKKKAAKK